MNVKLQTQGFDITPAIEAHTLDQLNFHLANFAAHVLNVDVFLRDINGPKGGPDKKVLINVRLTTRISVTVERTRSDFYAAITVAARQAKRAVRRNLSKHRRMEKLALRELQRLPQT